MIKVNLRICALLFTCCALMVKMWTVLYNCDVQCTSAVGAVYVLQ